MKQVHNRTISFCFEALQRCIAWQLEYAAGGQTDGGKKGLHCSVLRGLGENMLVDDVCFIFQHVVNFLWHQTFEGSEGREGSDGSEGISVISRRR